MVIKTVTYTDFNNEKRTETLRFNLTQSEVAKMAFSDKGNLEEILEKAVSENDRGFMIRFIETLILESYGEKSSDGRRFIKSEAIKEEFSQTAVYNELFMSLASDVKMLEEFVTGILPDALREKKE